MLRWLAHKALVLIPTLIGASLIAFALIRLIPGDPVLNLLGERGGTPEQIQEMRVRMGLDRSLPEQYFLFVGKALKGDMGESVISRRPVTEEFMDRFPATLELGFTALLWATLLGIPLGILAAVKRNSIFDYGVMGFSLIGYSMPIFWWGLLLILLFSVQLGWLPVSGRIDIVYDIPPVTGFLLIDVWFSPESLTAFWDALKHLVLPALALGTIPLAIISRITRASLLEVLQEDYMRTARAVGVSKGRLVFVYALRNALIPIITVLGVLVGSILTGAVLTETIFSWPGVGRWLVKSVEARDYPVIQGGILYMSFGIVVVNLLVDVIYAWANPRLRRNT
jgi:dipeptide transport system permease protein